jgi:small ligand-binding sensory domain FIST
MPAPFGAASSRHPVTAAATGEVAGALLEAVGPSPDLVVVTVSPEHGHHLAEVARTVGAALRTAAVVAVRSPAVVADGRIVGGPAVAGWAGSVGPTTIAHLGPGAGPATDGWPVDLHHRCAGVILVADARAADGPALASACRRHAPATPVAGGLVAPPDDGMPVLATPGGVAPGGAVALLLERPGALDVAASHGARPFGPPATVTAAEGRRVRRIASGTALEYLARAARAAGDGALGTAGLHLGVALRDGPGDPVPGDVVVHAVTAVDRASGAVDLDGPVPLGATVRCYGRDATSARDALLGALLDRSPGGALVFADASRRSLAPGGHDDAAVVAGAVPGAPVAGMVTVGTFSPAAGSTHVQHHAVTVACLHAR